MSAPYTDTDTHTNTHPDTHNDPMTDRLLKIAVTVLLALSGATLHFVIQTSARIAVLEYRVGYSLGPPPWERKP